MMLDNEVAMQEKNLTRHIKRMFYVILKKMINEDPHGQRSSLVWHTFVSLHSVIILFDLFLYKNGAWLHL